MLKKIYIDNYKSCVNFELEFGSINLLVGDNGVGKSTVFEILDQIQSFVAGNKTVSADDDRRIFPAEALTRWQQSPIQRFELSIEGNDGTYRYELAIEHELDDHGRPNKNLARVKYERLWFDSQPLLNFEIADGVSTVQMYKDNPDDGQGPSYTFDWTRSALSSIPEGPTNTKLTWFRRRLARIIIVQITPSLMIAEGRKEERSLSLDASNFASWYRFISGNQGRIVAITNELKDILDNFGYFNLDEIGDSKILKASFLKDKISREYRFDELSDGQRALICLYTVLGYAKSQDYTICIDEPSNHLALSEIQPWIVAVDDICSDGDLQALLISHNPELINYLVFSKAAIWFSRKDAFAPTRSIPFPDQGDIELPVAELVARGWIDE